MPSKTIYNVFSDCGLLLIAAKYISREIGCSHGEQIKKTLLRQEITAARREGRGHLLLRAGERDRFCGKPEFTQWPCWGRGSSLSIAQWKWE